MHKVEFNAYTEEMKDPGNKRKRSKTEATSTNQPRLPFSTTVIPPKESKVERLVADYLIDTMRPISTVEEKSFQTLISGNSTKDVVISNAYIIHFDFIFVRTD